MKTCVLGAGSWGTALACLLADNGHAVTLWGRDAVALSGLAQTRVNARYLPGVPVPAMVAVEPDLGRALSGAAVCVLALPSSAIGEVTGEVAPAFAGLAVCASKGLERSTGRTLDQVLHTAWPKAEVALLSGPTFAVEIARGQPAAAVAASRDLATAEAAQRSLSCERFRVYTSTDVVGVAIGGALKNVIAIAAGCSDALGFGYNARAALVTRGLLEMGRLAEKLGGDPLTLAGLAGLGDLVLTCTGELSRNRTVGYALGRGEPLSAVSARLGQVAEGVETAATALALAEKVGLEMPITKQVAAVLRGHATPRAAVANLLGRGLGPER